MRRQKVISDFKEFVSIQSVSADPKRLGETKEAADFLSNKLKKIGFKVKLVGNGRSPPLLFAILRSKNPDAKAIGIYGHYDIQPEDPLSEWKTPPFKLISRGDRFFGRGVADNKGPIIQSIAAVGNLVESGNLNNHVSFIFEGEEESQSGNFGKLARKVGKEISGTDCIYVTDVEMHDRKTPQILYALRGLVYFEIKLEVGKADIHSGIWGNSVPNPAQVLSELFAEMKSSKSGRISLPGFYKDVRKIDEKESHLLSKPFSKIRDLKNSGVFEMAYCDKQCPWLSAKTHPSMDIDGMVSGYTGEGAKTIIPRSASAKFSIRLVSYQDPEKIEKMVKEFVKNNIPQGVKYELKTLSKSSPFYTSLDNPYVSKTALALKEAFGREPMFNMDGGSIPAAVTLQRLFRRPIILTGFVNPDCNIHAPNENLDEECFWKGIEALERIYSQK